MSTFTRIPEESAKIDPNADWCPSRDFIAPTCLRDVAPTPHYNHSQNTSHGDGSDQKSIHTTYNNRTKTSYSPGYLSCGTRLHPSKKSNNLNAALHAGIKTLFLTASCFDQVELTFFKALVEEPRPQLLAQNSKLQNATRKSKRQKLEKRCETNLVPEQNTRSRKRSSKMRHPAAPTIVAVLLGLLGLLVLWGKLRGDGHHEGNPHPDDVPRKVDVQKLHGEDDDDEKEAKKP